MASRGVNGARTRNIINSLAVTAGLVILIIVFWVSSPYFMTTRNVYDIFQEVSVVSVMAVGQSFVIFTAGIDLSQGYLLSLCAVGGAEIMVSAHSIALGFIAALAMGLGSGLLSGLLITWAGLVPFIATLAMLGVTGGASLLFTNAQPVFNIPASFYAFGSNGVSVFPYIVMVAAGIALFFQVYSTETRGGRYIYAVGSNLQGATKVGIRTKRVLLGVYALSGLLVGIAAMLQVAYVNTGQPSDNTELLLESIAAVVIGGGSLFGGEGTIWGTMIGTLLIGVLYNGTELLGISTYVQTILLGLVIILAVCINNLRQKERVAA
ncbi:MAG: ABC transporter permease [Acidimicrobiales bacterium]